MTKKPLFQTIGVIGKQQDTEALETLKILRDALLQQNRTLLLEEQTASLLPGHSFSVKPMPELAACSELIIVIGGDGNLLNAARALSLSKTPVLGIHRGHLGFLTDIHPTALEEELLEVLSGQYYQEKRFLLSLRIEHQGKVTATGNALNEVLLSHGSVSKMIEFEVYIDEQFVYSERSDGLITATPTGSTAYALSADGPILHPSLDAIVLVPLCPHTLSSRPIVVEGNRRIKLVPSAHNKVYPKVSCDSQIVFPTVPGDEIHIEKQKGHLNLIHPKRYCYFKTLRNKLHWGRKL
ncbi:MAG: NAD(+) kinase [Gammaproteobacteria bacterium]|nr:NAD(+) kinase [Gammaproteobacteria bacterium]